MKVLNRICMQRLRFLIIKLSFVLFSGFGFGFGLGLGLGLGIANANDISNASSSYVSMHAKDKVKWLEWGSEALEKSRAENKPIFLSIGYFSCYWCHVLQRESFNDDVFAKRINESFIPVIVDRELHSSLDAYLTRFAEETIGRGGWPLNVILTPEGYPVVATIYLPVKDFTPWVNAVADLWMKDATYLRNAAEEAADEMALMVAVPLVRNKKQVSLSGDTGKKIVRQFIAEALSVADEFQGGFGDQAKFPLASILQPLLNIYANEEYSLAESSDQHANIKKQLGEFLQLTLNIMRNRGLFDHLSGGFFRYTTGPDWQLPHFEKMLYDNAQLASLYFNAGRVFKSASYTKTATELLDYLLENFQNKNGGFYASYSAIDEAGVEGGYYLWQVSQVSKLLTEDEFDVAILMWDWEKPPLLEDGYFPVPQKTKLLVAKKLNISIKNVEHLLANAMKKMKQAREKRSLPRDDKMLASWNALMLIALLDGYEATKLSRFKKAANGLANEIQNKLISNGKLYRSFHGASQSTNRSIQNKQYAGKASLEDYALVAMAMYRWASYETDRGKAYKLSSQLASTAWARFWSKDGWKTSDDMLIPNLSREAMIADGPLPSSSSMLIKVGLLLENEKLRVMSKQALEYGHNSLKNTPFWYASQVDVIFNMTQK